MFLYPMRPRRSLPAVFLVLLATAILLPAGSPAAAGGSTPPVIEWLNPTADTQVERGASLSIDFQCTDDTDPFPLCTGVQQSGPDLGWPGTSGEAVQFAATGTYVFEVQTSDASNNATSDTLTVTVVDAMCGGQVATAIWSLGEGATSGNDVILVDTSQLNWIDGLAGNDTICGADVADIIFGGTGNDRILSGLGNDLVFGGTGNDRLEGGTHNDRLEGDEGADTLLGGGAADRLEGGSGNDNLNGGPQSDRCFGQEGTQDRQAACEVRTGFP